MEDERVRAWGCSWQSLKQTSHHFNNISVTWTIWSGKTCRSWPRSLGSQPCQWALYYQTMHCSQTLWRRNCSTRKWRRLKSLSNSPRAKVISKNKPSPAMTKKTNFRLVRNNVPIQISFSLGNSVQSLTSYKESTHLTASWKASRVSTLRSASWRATVPLSWLNHRSRSLTFAVSVWTGKSKMCWLASMRIAENA